MQSYRLLKTSTIIFIGILFFGFAISCSSSTSSNGDGNIELIPNGLRIKQNNQVILEQNAAGTVTGNLSVANSSEGPTESVIFDLYYLAIGGVEFTPDPESHTLELNTSSSILSFKNVKSDQAPFSFQVDNDGTGSGTFTITLQKDSVNQFVSMSLPFEVINSSN